MSDGGLRMDAMALTSRWMLSPAQRTSRRLGVCRAFPTLSNKGAAHLPRDIRSLYEHCLCRAWRGNVVYIR